MAEAAGDRDETTEVHAAYARQARRWKHGSYRSWEPGNLFIEYESERVVLRLLERRGLLPLADREILDVGCGSGRALLRLLARGARVPGLHGVDVQQELIEEARGAAPSLDFRVGDATELPFADDSFDIVLASTMLSSMRSDASRAQAAREMLRVVRPSGCIVVYEFSVNPRNAEVRPLRPRDLRRLFPGLRLDSRRVSLAPPIARAIARRSWLACTLLGAVPLLRTHTLTVVSPPPGVSSPTAEGASRG